MIYIVRYELDKTAKVCLRLILYTRIFGALGPIMFTLVCLFVTLLHLGFTLNKLKIVRLFFRSTVQV